MFRTLLIWRAKLRPLTVWLCVTWIDPACWPPFSMPSRSEHINVQEMENIVFEGAEAAVARINLDNAPSGEMLDRIQSEKCRHHRTQPD